ncbi:MAG TPA: phospholipase A [Sulfuriferula sp.]|nr:phospholipase A [Sulfuriferula sp.]
MKQFSGCVGVNEIALMCGGLLMVAQMAHASPDLGTCPAIQNDAQRLACYDKLAGTIPLPPSPEQATQAVQPAPPAPALANVSLLSRQWELDDADKHGTFQFRPHRANYFLPVKYNDAPNNAPFRGNLLQRTDNLDSLEAKIQLSVKTKVVEGLFNKDADLWLGYTVSSYWQAYNRGVSAPFRETDYEPEAMLVFRTDYDIAGLKGRFINLGLVHKSNGRSVALSRSWNRIYAQFGFERGDFSLLVRPWYRIPESAANDNNPDIQDYLGRGDLVATYSNGGNTYSLLLRNNLKRSPNRGAVRADWSFPLQGRLKGYVQYFNGYGESLIDYNYKQQSIGIGVSLADWM